MAGWHHNPMDMSLSKFHELVMGQGSLACCSRWGLKELDIPEVTEGRTVKSDPL